MSTFIDNLINDKAQNLCEFCHNPKPLGGALNRKYCSQKCLKRAERARAKERDSMFYGSSPAPDDRFLWSETNPTLARITECITVLRLYNNLKPADLPIRVIQFTVAVPVAVPDAGLLLDGDYVLFQLRDWVGQKNVYLNKWILQPKAGLLQSPAMDVVPQHVADAARTGLILAEDAAVERQIAEQEEAAAARNKEEGRAAEGVSLRADAEVERLIEVTERRKYSMEELQQMRKVADASLPPVDLTGL